MIKVEKDIVPEILKSEKVERALEKLEEFYSSNKRAQKRYSFPYRKEIDYELRTTLAEVFYEKCGYCETKVTVEKAVVDRFRPYNGIRDKDDYYKDLYWWLTYDWDNLIYSCKECSQYKANYFPIEGERANSNDENSINFEEPLLISPYEDSIGAQIDFDRNGNIYGITDKGATTIDLLRLDRKTLLKEREQVIITIGQATNLLLFAKNPDDEMLFEAKRKLKDIFEEKKSIAHLNFAKRYLMEEIDIHISLRSLLGIDYDTIAYPKDRVRKEDEDYKINEGESMTQYFPIDKIHIKNFKNIVNLEIDFPSASEDSGEPWLFLLGENGVGKSSVLQAIAIGISSHSYKNRNKLKKLVKHEAEAAEITIKERGRDNEITTKIGATGKINREGEGVFNSYLLGYGAVRLMYHDELETEKQEGRIRFENLFNPIRCLGDGIKWMKDLYVDDEDRFDTIAYSLKELLPLNMEESGYNITVHEEELVFDHDKKTPITSFSQGYKSVISLALDIMMTLSKGDNMNVDIDKLEGIILIDEIGNQLHPRWQMQIVPQMRKIFPKIQFIVSSHNPLCLRGIKGGEVAILKEVNGEAKLIENLPDPSEFRVDQLLASEFFGLSSLIDPELEKTFFRYYQLLNNQDSLNKEEKEELKLLVKDLTKKQHFGDSLRDELMYYVIDELLATKVKFSEDPPNRTNLKKEVVTKVKEIWKSVNIEYYDKGEAN